ncbi:MAG: hypothetical protein QOK43_2128, partial [Acidimicrobiaceae bacterium]|nr:hypothetical protein [Acidimicrobiaceae bacterium]
MPSDQSPFETLDAAFRALCEEPANLSLDGRSLGWPFPARPIPLGELRGRLLHPATPHEARDRAMA